MKYTQEFCTHNRFLKSLHAHHPPAPPESPQREPREGSPKRPPKGAPKGSPQRSPQRAPPKGSPKRPPKRAPKRPPKRTLRGSPKRKMSTLLAKWPIFGAGPEAAPKRNLRASPKRTFSLWGPLWGALWGRPLGAPFGGSFGAPFGGPFGGKPPHPLVDSWIFDVCAISVVSLSCGTKLHIKRSPSHPQASKPSHNGAKMLSKTTLNR